MSQVDVNIIVPFRNSSQHLRALLECLVEQRLDEPAEILCVDNGSTDDSSLIVTAVSGNLPVRLIRAVDRPGAAYARNVGAKAAAGRKLLFIDADDLVAPGYVAAMASALDRHKLVTSRVDSVTLNPEWVRHAHGPPWQAEGIATFFDFLPATGVNIGISRELFERLGGFPEMFEPSEDIALSWNAQLAGESIQFVPNARYLYRYRHTVRGLLAQSRRWGTSNVILYRRFRALGMPRRPWERVATEWHAALKGVANARRPSQMAPAVVALGYCVGRFIGSIRYRTVYF